MKNNKIGWLVLCKRITFLVVISVLMVQCKDPNITETTTKEVVITGYLQKDPEQFSEFMKILDITGNSGFLSAYGLYTCFAPTNDAVRLYLQTKGANTVEDIEPSELKKLVRFHIMLDTISTASFTDGKLDKPTMLGQYLTTGAINIGGESYSRINRQANVTKSNQRVNNGIIHVIDRVLEPASLTISQMIEQDQRYSIFLQALKDTRFYDTLNTVTIRENGSRKWYTLIAESDEVFKKNGIATYEDLKNRYLDKIKKDPTNPQDSLWLFVAYHILPDIQYLADLITAPSHSTLAPLEVITTRLDNQDVLINADLYLGVQEPGVKIKRVDSDNSATNGVLHSVLGTYAIKIRIPYAVYWDVADQPELRKMTSIFRKSINNTVNLALGTLKDVTWGGASTSTISYVTVNPSGAKPDQYVYYDRLNLNIKPSAIPWIEFITPLLVKGKYKVWICYRVTAYNDMQAYLDDDPLPRIFGLFPTVYYPANYPSNSNLPANYVLNGTDEGNAEAQGWKIYTSWLGGGASSWLGRLIRTIDIKTTDRHRFKIVGLSNRGGGQGNPFILDMVHFIPVDQQQVYPKFGPDGSQMAKPY